MWVQYKSYKPSRVLPFTSIPHTLRWLQWTTWAPKPKSSRSMNTSRCKTLISWQHVYSPTILITYLLIATADSGSRRRKQSLQTGYSDQVNDLLVDCCITDIKIFRKTINTRAASKTLKSGGNRVLSDMRTSVNVDVAKLDLRSSPQVGGPFCLAQLESGYF